MLTLDKVLFLSNTFVVDSNSVGKQVLHMLPKVCVGNTIVVKGGAVLKQGQDFSAAITKSGSPLAFV